MYIELQQEQWLLLLGSHRVYGPEKPTIQLK